MDKLTSSEFIELISETAQSLFETDYNNIDTKNFECLVSVFKVIVNETININSAERKNIVKLIKIFLKRFFLLYDKEEKSNHHSCQSIFRCEFIIEEIDKISNFLKTCGENNFWTDCFTYLIKLTFDSSYSNLTSTSPLELKLLMLKNMPKVK